MTATVPSKRVDETVLEILGGRAVRSITWQNLGSLANWILGQGANVIPYNTQIRSLAAGSTYSCKYYYRQRFQAVARVWVIGLVKVTTGSASTTVTLPEGGTVDIVPSDDGTQPSWAFVVENLSAQKETDSDLTVSFNVTGENQYVYGLAAYDVPRLSLDPSTADTGIAQTTKLPGEPITYTDMFNFHTCASSPTAIGRRCSFLQWAVPYSDGATTTTYAWSRSSGTYAGVFKDSKGIPLLTRKDLRTSTTGTVTARAYCWKSGGGTGKFRIASSEQGEGTATDVTWASPAWTPEVTMTFDCENFSNSNGLQGGTTISNVDYFQAQAHSGDGGTTIYIASVAAWED